MWCSFFVQERNIMGNRKPETIYCPICHRRVGVYDGKSTINVIMRCKKCRKQVVYNIETGETTAKSLPPRTTSSGMTY